MCLEGGNLRMIPFEQMRDPETGRTKVRLVDMQSEHYRVARQYMIRLNRRDLEDPEMLGKLAAAGNMTPEAFAEEFASAATGPEEMAAVMGE